MNDITAIFAFLKYCLESKEDMSRVIAGMNWHELYSFASKQALRYAESGWDEVLGFERAGECLDVSESLFTYSWRY